jgi:hypothetical protein
VLDRALLTALKAFRFAAATDEVWNRQNNRSTGS